nr:hyothetical protein [Toxoplasma gondii RH]
MESGLETRLPEGRILGALPDSAVAPRHLDAAGGADLLCVLSRSALPSRVPKEAHPRTCLPLPLPLSLAPVVRHQLSQAERPRAASSLSLPAIPVGEGRSGQHPGRLASPLSSFRRSSLCSGASRPRSHCFSLSPAVPETAKRNRESLPHTVSLDRETQKTAAENENHGTNLSDWRTPQEVTSKERWGRRQVYLVFPRDFAPFGNAGTRRLRSASLLRGRNDNAGRQIPPPSPSFVSLPPRPPRQLASEAQQAFSPFASPAYAPGNTIFLPSSLCFPQGQTEKKSDARTTTSSYLQNSRRKPKSPSLPASSSTPTSLCTPPLSSASSSLSSSLSSFSVSSSVLSSLDSSLSSSASSSVSAAPGALCASASLATGDLRGWPRAATDPAGVSVLLETGAFRPASLPFCEAHSRPLNAEVPMGRLHAPPPLPWSKARNHFDAVADKTAPAMTANNVRSNLRLAEASQTLATDTAVSSFPSNLQFIASRHSASTYASSQPSPGPHPSCHPSSYPPSVSPSFCAPCSSFCSSSSFSSSSFSCSSSACSGCSFSSCSSSSCSGCLFSSCSSSSWSGCSFSSCSSSSCSSSSCSGCSFSSCSSSSCSGCSSSSCSSSSWSGCSFSSCSSSSCSGCSFSSCSSSSCSGCSSSSCSSSSWSGCSFSSCSSSSCSGCSFSSCSSSSCSGCSSSSCSSSSCSGCSFSSCSSSSCSGCSSSSCSSSSWSGCSFSSCSSSSCSTCSLPCFYGIPFSSFAPLSVSFPGSRRSTPDHCGFSRVSFLAVPFLASPGGRSALPPSSPPSRNSVFEEKRGSEATIEQSSLALFPTLSGETSPARASRLPPVKDMPPFSPCVYSMASESTGPLRCVSSLTESSPEQMEPENAFPVSSKGSSQLFRSSPSPNLIFSLGEHPVASRPSVSQPSFPLHEAASQIPLPASLPAAASTVPSLFSTSSSSLLTKSVAAVPLAPRARLLVSANTREAQEREETKNLQRPPSTWKSLVETATHQGLQATSCLTAQRRQEGICPQRRAAAYRPKGEGKTDTPTAVFGVKEKQTAKKSMLSNPEEGVDGEEEEQGEEREEGRERGEEVELWLEGIEGPGRRFDLRRVRPDRDEENRLRGRRPDIGQVTRESGGKDRVSDTPEENKMFSLTFSASSPRAKPQQRHSISCMPDLSGPEPLAAPFRDRGGIDEVNRSGEQIAPETERRQGRCCSVPGWRASSSSLHPRGPPRAASLLCLLPPGAQEYGLPPSLAEGVRCSSCSSASSPSSPSCVSPRPLSCSSPTFCGYVAASARAEEVEEREPRLRETEGANLQRQATAGENERGEMERLRACRDPFRQRRQVKEDSKRETKETRERQEGVSIPGGRGRGQQKTSKNGGEAARKGTETTEGEGLGGDREDNCGEGQLKAKEINEGDREKAERTEIGDCGEAGGAGPMSDVPAEKRRGRDEKEEKQIRKLPLETRRDPEERTMEAQRALQSDNQKRELREEKRRSSEKPSREALKGEEGETGREGEQDDTPKEQKKGNEELVAGVRGKGVEDNPAEEGEASRKVTEKQRSINLGREKEGQTLLAQKQKKRRSHQATHSKSLDSEAAHEERRDTSGCEATAAKKTISREHPRFLARKDVTDKAGKKPPGGDRRVQRQAASAERDDSRVVKKTKEKAKTRECLVACGKASPSSLREGENLKRCDTQGGSRHYSGFSIKIGRNVRPLPGSSSSSLASSSSSLTLASSSPPARAASRVRRSLLKEGAGDACSGFAFLCRDANNKGRRTQVSAENGDKEKKRDLNEKREIKEKGEMKEQLLHERLRRQQAGGLSRPHSLPLVEVPFSCA